MRDVPAGAPVFGAEECEVELRVVCGDSRAGQALVDVCDHVCEHGGVGDVGVGDAVDVGRTHGALRVDARPPFLEDAAPWVSCDDRYLNDSVLVGGQASGFDVEHSEVRLPRLGPRGRHCPLKSGCRLASAAIGAELVEDAHVLLPSRWLGACHVGTKTGRSNGKQTYERNLGKLWWAASSARGDPGPFEAALRRTHVRARLMMQGPS